MITPFADLDAVLVEVVVRNRALLGGEFVGAYLQGSLATGDFDERSDVDYVIVVERDLPDARIPELNALQESLYALASYWARHLEGSYLPRAALAQLPPPRRAFLYFDNGHRRLMRSTHDDSLVVYWVLRERGIVLAGPDPKALVAPVPWADLRDEIVATMRDWGAELLTTSKMSNRWYQAFAVLSYCRMLHALSVRSIESKRVAAQWAETALDRRWQGLIRRAWDTRAAMSPAELTRQPADVAEIAATADFIRWCVEAAEASE